MPHFLSNRRWAMKVLVHLNHGLNKTYLLHFNRRMTRETIRQILTADDSVATQMLILASAKKVEVAAEEKISAERSADFVISQQGYTAEKLA